MIKSLIKRLIYKINTPFREDVNGEITRAVDKINTQTAKTVDDAIRGLLMPVLSKRLDENFLKLRQGIDVKLSPNSPRFLINFLSPESNEHSELFSLMRSLWPQQSSPRESSIETTKIRQRNFIYLKDNRKSKFYFVDQEGFSASNDALPTLAPREYTDPANLEELLPKISNSNENGFNKILFALGDEGLALLANIGIYANIFDQIVIELSGLEKLANEPHRSIVPMIIHGLMKNFYSISFSASNLDGMVSLDGVPLPRTIKITLVNKISFHPASGKMEEYLTVERDDPLAPDVFIDHLKA